VSLRTAVQPLRLQSPRCAADSIRSRHAAPPRPRFRSIETLRAGVPPYRSQGSCASSACAFGQQPKQRRFGRWRGGGEERREVTVLMEGYRRCLLSRPAQELAPPGLAILTGPHWLPAEVRHLAGKAPLGDHAPSHRRNRGGPRAVQAWPQRNWPVGSPQDFFVGPEAARDHVARHSNLQDAERVDASKLLSTPVITDRRMRPPERRSSRLSCSACDRTKATWVL
jgi:hypothetical protein